MSTDLKRNDPAAPEFKLSGFVNNGVHQLTEKRGTLNIKTTWAPESKFVEGVLTSEGCMMRHDGHRDKELNTKDDPAMSEYGKSEWYEEVSLLNSVHSLRAMGAKIRRRGYVSERLETFVRRNKKLGD